MATTEPIAVRAAIPPLASAIKVGGQEDEPVRLTIDIYPEEADLVQRLMHLRGSELFLTLQPAE
jgi:hypothetical protein